MRHRRSEFLRIQLPLEFKKPLFSSVIILHGVALTGLTSLEGATDPAINRGAIIRCPFGTKTAQFQKIANEVTPDVYADEGALGGSSGEDADCRPCLRTAERTPEIPAAVCRRALRWYPIVGLDKPVGCCRGSPIGDGTHVSKWSAVYVFHR